MCREALLACEVVQGKTFNEKILILKIIFHHFLWWEDDQGALKEEALKSKIGLQSFDIADVLKQYYAGKVFFIKFLLTDGGHFNQFCNLIQSLIRQICSKQCN